MSTSIRSEATRTVIVVNGVDIMAINSNGSVDLLTAPAPTGENLVPQSKVTGLNQTWQLVTGSRVSGTLYTNNTGKPIHVMVDTASAGAGSTFNLTSEVDGVVIQTAVNDYQVGTSFIVPPGSTYRVTATGAINRWAELR